MLNFFLGTVAGGLIACVLTIAAARHPEVQARLGLKAAAAPIALAAAPRAPEPECGRRQDTASKSSAQEILFNRQRFWSVSP